jgi:hypothetical protein
MAMAGRRYAFSRRIQRAAAALLLGAGTVAALPSPSGAVITLAVKGSATGYLSNVSLFGGPYSQRGPAGTPGCDATSTTACSPSVELPITGGNPSATDVDGATAQYGPAIIFSAGQMDVSTQGTTGFTGSVTSSASIQNVNKSGQEVFTAAAASSTCTASQAGVSGSTTITNGTLQTSEGDPNVEGDETVVPIAANPPANTSYNGVLEGVGDSFRYVFNEHVRNLDGSITVYAAHLYLLGPTAVGDLFISKSECGVILPAVTALLP